MTSLMRVAGACGSGQYAVVCTSGGVIAAICQELLGLPAQQVPLVHTPLFNGSITTLLTRGNQMVVSTFNSVAHFELPAGEERLVTYR